MGMFSSLELIGRGSKKNIAVEGNQECKWTSMEYDIQGCNNNLLSTTGAGRQLNYCRSSVLHAGDGEMCLETVSKKTVT